MQGRTADDTSSGNAAAQDASARHEQLEAVGRVLKPVLEPAVARAFEQKLAALSRILASVRSHSRTLDVGIGSADAAAAEGAALDKELQRVQTEFDAHAAAVCAAIDAIPLALLRKAFIASELARRTDLLALVDLVLEERQAIARRCDLLDYLTTLLSTENKGGRHRVARDPVTLTPRLAESCARIAEESQEDLHALEQEFVQAARRCESGDLGTVVPEVRARKTQVGVAIFAPGVLRAVVYYNAMVATSLRARLGGERAAAPVAAPSSRPSAPVAAPFMPAARAAAAGPEVPAPAAPVAVRAEAAAEGALAAVPPSADEALPPSEDEDLFAAPVEADALRPPSAPPAQATVPEAGIQWKVAPQASAPPPHSPAQRTVTRRRRRFVGIGLAAGTLAAACAALFLAGTPPDRAQQLTAAELQRLPGFVQDGYRDHARKGTLFIGTVAADWDQLSSDERMERVTRLVADLSGDGVQEILLYDPHQRLVVHHAAGLPLRLL